MAVYINLKAGIGKPLWEVTLEEFTVWYEVSERLPRFIESY
jgi:hypothetical protein